MGACQSLLGEENANKMKAMAEQAAASQGIQLTVTGEQGAFAPHSDASFLTLDVLVGNEKFEGCAFGSIDAEINYDRDLRHSTSTKIFKGFGMTKELKGEIRVDHEAE